eukprot:scaffold22058_cov39-Tisochrysis_lutea.AAC.1
MRAVLPEIEGGMEPLERRSEDNERSQAGFDQIGLSARMRSLLKGHIGAMVAGEHMGDCETGGFWHVHESEARKRPRGG